MAKYNVTHSCGHEHEYKLFGKTRERDGKMAWLARQECPECRRKAAEEAAKVATEGMELPELEGSEKQVKWANTIRGQFINAIRTYNETCAFGAGNPRIDVDKALSIIASVKTARDFIDNRDMDVLAFLILMSRKNEQKPAETPAPTKVVETPAPAQKTPTWGKVAINVQNVERNTEKAALINMPHSSDHDGYSVWVSLKLLRSGRHSYEYMLSIKADMEFVLKKYGKGKWNKSQVIDEKTINAEEMAAAFGGWVSDAPRMAAPAIDPDKEEIIKHEPARLEPVEIEADPELVR